MFQGLITAIVTPFYCGQVDYDQLEALIHFQIENQVDGIVACGTTGESATLTDEEYKKLLSFIVDVVDHRIPVLAGTGTNSTAKTLERTQYAKNVKADGVLMVTPYYNKPTQRGLVKHFTNIADQVNIPIVLYNIASRTAVNIHSETMIELAKHPNIVGVKESSGDLLQVTEILQGTQDFIVLSGDDFLTLPICSLGGLGVVSVLSNILPKQTKDFVESCLSFDLRKARLFHEKYYQLTKALFLETNPVPIKTALSCMGKIHSEVRLPLCEMETQNKDILKKLLYEKKLIT